jgi:hypothetical protein
MEKAFEEGQGSYRDVEPAMMMMMTMIMLMLIYRSLGIFFLT